MISIVGTVKCGICGRPCPEYFEQNGGCGFYYYICEKHGLIKE